MKINHTLSNIKDFNRIMFNKSKDKNKKLVYRYYLQCFSSKRLLMEQGVRLKCSSIKFKQLAVPFKIYADFECNMKGVKGSDENNNTSYTEKYQDHIPCSFADKFVCVNDKFSKPIVFYKSENAVYKVINAILKKYDYCKNVMNENLNKNLAMSVEDEKRF